MKPIGGEQHLKRTARFAYTTDSGRSSLKLILKSLPKRTRFLIPDFLCKVIPQVFAEAGIPFSFYRVKKDLGVDFGTVKGRSFDAIYAIDYFGKKQELIGKVPASALIVEDCVFLPVVERPVCAENWIGFNSFRKISPLADGSIIRSTRELCGDLIRKDDARFSGVKYEAKNIKYEYMDDGRHSERRYLDLFAKAERMLDAQKRICAMSGRSMANLFDFYKDSDREYATRGENYAELDKGLEKMKIPLRADFLSFYPLAVDRRDELRKYLFSKRVFLPVHWPAIEGLDNDLYRRIISIPVDSRYSKADMRRVASLIKNFYKG